MLFDNSTINFLILGFGPHTKRIYHPLLELAAEDESVNLKAALDVQAGEAKAREYLADKQVQPELHFIDCKEVTERQLSCRLTNLLNDIVHRHQINSVIIATEPLVHFPYAKWALQKGLSVLMDKPISSYENVANNLRKARQVAADYYELNDCYLQSQKSHPRQMFSMMAQRRHQTSFTILKEKIEDCFKQTNCPVTNFQTFHSDGQWRMPTEVVEQHYHPYNQGYGKCSHSGYHYFDIIPYVLESGLGGNKYYDNAEVFANAVRPLDVLQQFSLDDYRKLFGLKHFDKNNKYSSEELTFLMQNYGEVDCSSNISFRQGNKTLTNLSINLTHNGYSQRNWVSAIGRDLYKGNGRVSHESHIIQQGPFQNIHFHSYKSDHEHRKGDPIIGTKEHLEIYVFRNHKMLGGNHVETFDISDLRQQEGGNKGLSGKSKSKLYYEFIEGIRGNITREEVKSDFSKHEAGALITSAVYQSICHAAQNENPLVKTSLPLGMPLAVAEQLKHSA
ncbi:Gfo/Idh/MocA family oxidoreductase [Alteromonas sp. H39]|uniref:Gfo/Idh/MocA family oxidoreductase n=1 Tax=Alteromonas sp. H39 TaxID=3389876 RepID=UPI0039E0454F